MSFGGGYQGGRTRMGTKVLLNVYDLSPANDLLYSIGFGLHHSGVVVHGREYSFGSGGDGIYDTEPNEDVASGGGGGMLVLRESVEMGTYDGDTSDLRSVIGDLRSSFRSSDYDLIRKNCNHFSNALVWALLGKTIPSHVNRLADVGACCSCLLPSRLLGESPVGNGNGNGTGGGGGGGFGRPSPSVAVAPPMTAFMGRGSKLGGDNGGNGSRGGSSDPLTDRREKARQAALARLERNNGGAASANGSGSGIGGVVGGNNKSGGGR